MGPPRGPLQQARLLEPSISSLDMPSVLASALDVMAELLSVIPSRKYTRLQTLCKDAMQADIWRNFAQEDRCDRVTPHLL